MTFFGMAGSAAVELSGGTFAHVQVIYMASQTIVDDSILWLAPERGVESACARASDPEFRTHCSP